MKRFPSRLTDLGRAIVGRGARVTGVVMVVGIALLALQHNVFLAARPTAALSGVHVSGNKLLDGAGQPVLLHGADMSGQEFACAQGGTPGNEGWGIFGGQPEDSPATFAAMQSWHINAVRVPLNEDCWLGINGINPAYGGANYRSAITTLVSDLNKAGFYVIVDLHWNAPGTKVALSQQPMADEDHSPAFWQSVATTFSNNPNVIFDLYNEPFLYGNYFQNSNQDPWACWLNGCGLNQYLTGGQPYTQPYAWQTAGMQQLVNSVRGAGASNVILVNGLDWANDDSGWLAHQPVDVAGNLAVGAHIYNTESCDTVACWNQVLAPITQRYPIIVGETGDQANASCTLSFLPTLLPWADAHGISYLAWTWNAWGYTHDDLISDWSGTPTACEGQYYQAHLAALAGAPIGTPSPGNSPTPVPGPSSVPSSGSTQGGINVEPSARPWQYLGANPDGWFCPSAATCSGGADPIARINHELDEAAILHVANVRLEIPWFLVEPQRGVYDWSRVDTIFSAAQARGVRIQPFLDYTPAWAGGYNAFPPAGDFQAFVAAFMARHGGQISAVEMWNEPDGGQSLASNDPASYVKDILIPGYTAVHSSSHPGVKVIEGGSINDAGGNPAWL
ncbi:MAG TPA: cellulase family glycosylhydrolase, partial [Candidatus Acidoferrales bacterium]|nr:cellulase family glycosylhydrolase [Candidatus Acidoferrales bacterium]